MKKSVFLIIISVLTALTGCAGKNISEGITGNQNSSNDKNYDFIFVCPAIDNEYWKQCAEGIRKADAELGTDTKIIGPKNAEDFAETLSGYMEDAIAEKPDGIMAYAGIESMYPLIDKASENDIPVLTVENDAPDTARIAYVGSDDYNSGYEAGEAMAELTGGSAKVGMLVSSMSAENEMKSKDAFLDAVNDYDIEITAVAETNADTAAAEEKTRQMLAEHPEITAMFNTAGNNVTGAGRVKKELGRSDLILLGFDDIEENLRLVREGVINGIFAQKIEQTGYQSVYLMKEYLDNGSLPHKNYYANTVFVNKENVDSYSVNETIPGGENKIVRVGYYSGDTSFQNGFDDSVRKSGYAYDYYQAIAAMTGWKYDYVYGKRADMTQKLIDGEIDIAAGIYKTNELEHRVLFSDSDIGLDGEKRYFAVNKNRPELLKELNSAVSQLFEYTPDFQVTLKQKYYSQSANLVLSDAEKKWLADKGTLKMGYVGHNLPISDKDENGQITGMVKNLYRRIGNFLRTDIEPVFYDNITDMENDLINSKIDAAFPIYSDRWISENKNFHQTEPIISDRVMIVYKGEYTEDIMDRVVLSRTGIGQRYYMEVHYPDSEVVFCDSRGKALEAILNGDERCIVGCSSILQRFISEHSEYKNLNIAYLDTSEDFGMAVSEKSFPLTEILNKAVKQLDNASITSSIMQYSGIERQFTLREFIKENSIVVFAVLSVFFAILIVVFMSFIRKTRIFNIEQAETRAELEKALKAAEVASEAKTTFLSSMSHDIRTPMNAIVGMTSIASNHLTDTEKVKECIDKINLSSHYLITLINDVLDISKIESGKLALNPVVFSLRNTVNELVNIVRPQIKAKNLNFEVHIRDIDFENLYADEVRINQIFVNILTNAVKYTPDYGSVTMSLSEKPVNNGEKVRLTYIVEDTGIGMSDEFMENMYDTFARAKDSRINKIQGTGLGLAIVKQMVDMIGGTIECQSAENKGTKFTVTLDLPAVNENNEEKPLVTGLKVLLADDDEIFLDNAVDVLLDMEALPETATGGVAAVEKVRAAHAAGNDYSVIIVDWKMPDMDGLETIKAIREITGGKVSIILVSAYDWIEIEDDAVNCGANGFISKPLFRSCVYEKLSEILELENKNSEDEKTQNSDLSGKHMLVAEDNAINWEVLNELLSMYGITADWAQNGKICVDMLSSAPPGTYDMVLMDIQMPVMNGREAAGKIRDSEKEHIKNIPIIAITADAFAEDIAASFEAGMNGHVSKPIDIDSLCQEMHKIFNKQKRNMDK